MEYTLKVITPHKTYTSVPFPESDVEVLYEELKKLSNFFFVMTDENSKEQVILSKKILLNSIIEVIKV